MNRRRFGSLLAGCGVAASLTPDAHARREPQGSGKVAIIPPPGARLQTTACAYCIVACGYRVYTWPVGEMGGPSASENAFGVEFPVAPLSGYWIAPQMHTVVEIEGRPHHVVVLPDPTSEVVNVRGNYHLGGSLAQRLYTPDGPTNDRLLYPQIRVDGVLHRITWEEATDLVARVGRHVLDTRGPLAWGMKTYSYQFYENTFAITKLAFDAVGTPCWAPHDSPLKGSDVPGLSDAGIDNFSAAYRDWRDADVIFVSGVSLHEAHGILFDDWVKAGGAKLVVVDPRRGPTADYALGSGGMHLQITPGTDTLLHNALAWVILDEGWHDAEWIDRWTGGAGDLPLKESDNWRRFRFAATFEDYARFIFSRPEHVPEVAAPIIGLDPEQIRAAARLLARPGGGVRPRTSVMLEKGNYWALNYPNTASLASLGLLVGAGNRPGRVISRAGGHQRGMIKGGHYPLEKSPDRIGGYPAGLNLDRWCAEGNLSFVWVVGCTWAAGGTASASALYDRLYTQARRTGPELRADVVFPNGVDGGLDVGLAADALRRKVDAGGLVFVQQDIYPQRLTDLADLVLPAATWGEGRFSRMNGERRLRIYAQIVDPPGEALPDWQIISRVARYMGYEGFDWDDTAQLFREAGRHSSSAHDYRAIVELADDTGTDAMDLVEAMGTAGIQCPVVRQGESLRGTVRMHENGFKTKSGRALFVLGRWIDVLDRDGELLPRGDELWVINRRVSGTWSSMVEDLRNPFRVQQLPYNPILMHPDDAAERGLAHGAHARVVRSDPDAEFRGVIEITEDVRRGVVCAYFNFLGDPLYAANNVTSAEGDPVSGKFAFKLGRGRVLPVESR